jgi:hypothetical protein
MEKSEHETPRKDDVMASASRLIVLDERRNCQNSELIFVVLNRTLFLALDAIMVLSGRTLGVSVAYFLSIAAVLCAVWYWEMILIRSRLRTIDELVTQVEFQEYGQRSSAKSWVDALIQLGYLSNYGSTVLTSSRWRLAEPIIWFVLAIGIFALIRFV